MTISVVFRTIFIFSKINTTETYLVSYNFHPLSDNLCQQYDLIGRHMWGYKRGHVCQDKTGTHVACSQQVASETLKNERHAKWRQKPKF